MDDKHFVFVGGLHRSGTSLIHNCLRDHPAISGFSDTGVPEDEGQFLQPILQPAHVYGGAGRFGFHPDARLTEESELATSASAHRIYASWSRHWNATHSYLLEKSPPNMIRMRLLQALFSSSYFIIVIRHPLAVAMATRKWCKSSINQLIRHWIVCHKIVSQDQPFIRHILIVRYEDFVDDPPSSMQRITDFLGLPPCPVHQNVMSGKNEQYFEDLRAGIDAGTVAQLGMMHKVEPQVQAFGYSIADVLISHRINRETGNG